MRAKSMLLILIALGCGLVASIAISQVMERGKSANTGLETVQIYVATADIDMNEQLSASNVRLEDWPKSKVPEGAIVNLSDINERFARVRFYQGEPILQAKLANEIDGPAIKIPDGYRVCSLKVQMEQAVSNLVNPGDRVDIFGYFRQGRGIPVTGTRQILNNVRVFAVNERTETETDQQGRTIAAKTVSVLVKEDQVARLMLAAEMGTLRLALRRPNESLENESKHGETATVESLFGSQSESADPHQQPQPIDPAAVASAGLTGLPNQVPGSNPPALPPVLDLPPAGPAWQMTVLTPDGGTCFTWNDEDDLPNEFGLGAVRSNAAAPATSAAAQGSAPNQAWPPRPAATGAASAAPDKSPDPEPEPEPVDEPPTQESDQLSDSHEGR